MLSCFYVIFSALIAKDNSVNATEVPSKWFLVLPFIYILATSAVLVMIFRDDFLIEKGIGKFRGILVIICFILSILYYYGMFLKKKRLF